MFSSNVPSINLSQGHVIRYDDGCVWFDNEDIKKESPYLIPEDYHKKEVDQVLQVSDEFGIVEINQTMSVWCCPNVKIIAAFIPQKIWENPKLVDLRGKKFLKFADSSNNVHSASKVKQIWTNERIRK